MVYLSTGVLGLFKEEKEIRFIGLADNADTDIKGNKKSRQINGLVNEWYLEDLSENIKSVLRSKREKGLHTGGLVLYGYKKDPNQKGHLIIDPEAADVVRTVFKLYAGGMGKTAIARELNNRGIPNPTQYKLQKDISYKVPPNRLGTLWKYSAITDMLQNEMYIGNMVQGRYGSISYKSKKNKPKPKDEWVIVKGTHEPIIDIELWNSVQSKINSNFKPCSNGKIGIFAKKCRCKHCGYILKSSKSHDDRYLRCPTRQVDKSCCVGSFISENVLKRTILNELNLLINQYLDVDNLEQSIVSNEIRSEKDSLKQEIEQYNVTLKKKANAIKCLYSDKAEGIISQEQFIEYNNDFQREKEAIEVLLAEKNKRLSELANENDVLNEKKQILQQYINVTELSREMMENLIDYIEVSAKDPITKKKTIEIHWKF